MILSKIGECFEYDGKTYTIGEQIAATDQSEYEGLVGSIVEIRDGEDKETENETPDIYCSFDEPILPEDIAALEQRFSELYEEPKVLEDLALDYVVMAPDMITSTSEVRNVRNNCKKITIYALTEDWAYNDSYGFSTELYANPDDAVREFKLRLGIEVNNGMISDIRDDSEFVEDIAYNSYECYIDGRHCETHYIIGIEEKELYLSDVFMKLIADMKINEARTEDFVEQITDWDELGCLSEKQYSELITKPGIADRISSALTANDNFNEAYWQTVSEVAHKIVDEYLKGVKLK